MTDNKRLIKNMFPKNIKTLTYYKFLNQNVSKGPYAFAIYKDSYGNKYFVKRWTGKKKNLEYRWLLNEAVVYKEINKLSFSGNITIPKFIDIFIDKNSCYLIVEYIEGKNIKNFSENEKSEIFLKIINFLTNSGEKMSLNSRRDIANRSSIYWLLILPFITSFSIYKHPRYVFPIIKNFLYVVRFSFYILSRKEKALVHRDLNDENVLIKNKRIFIIDLELVSFTDPVIDYAILILKYSLNKKFIKALHNSLQFRNYFMDNKMQKILTSYMIILAIYDLCFRAGFHEASFNVLNKNFKTHIYNEN